MARQSTCRRLMAAVWLAASVAASNAASAQSSPPGGSFAEAYRLSQAAKTQDDFTAIINACTSALDDGPSDSDAAYGRRLLAWAHYMRGKTWVDAGDDDRAIADFDESIRLDGSKYLTYHHRGVSHATAGRLSEAQSDFEQVIRLKPDFPLGWFNRGELHYLRGQWQAAITDYDQALRHKGDDAPMLTARGHAHYRKGDFRAALDDFARALRVDPRHAPALTHRAVLYAELGRYPQAADDFRAAIRLEPQSAQAYQGAAWLMATCPDSRYRDPATAVEAARKALDLAKVEHYRFHDTLAAALAAAGQFDEAVAEQQKAVALADEAIDGEPDAQLVRELQQRLRLYQQAQPYREQAAAR